MTNFLTPYPPPSSKINRFILKKTIEFKNTSQISRLLPIPFCVDFINIWALTGLTNSIDLAMNDLCYEYSEDGVCLNSFDCDFVDKEIRCTFKTEIKDGLQYTNKKLSLPGL